MRTSTKEFLIHSVFAAGIVFSLTGCGGKETQYVKGIHYDVGDNDLELGVEFNPDLEFNTEVSFPIMEYGEVKLIPSAGTEGMKIALNLHTDVFVDPRYLTLEKTRLLPNGQPMSSYITTDVARFRTQPHPMVAANVYLGLEPKDHLYLGFAIELGYIDQHFPEGLVLSQRIRGLKNGRDYGVVTLFGPRVEGGTMVSSGGLFFMTNVSDLIRYGQEDSDRASSVLSQIPREFEESLAPASSTEINQPYEATYSDSANQYKLFKLYKKYGKKAGYID